MPRITASGTSSPRSIAALAARPIGVLSRTAARSSSPVASVGTSSAAASSGACVPLPPPGFPKRTMIMRSGWRSEVGGGSEQYLLRPPTSHLRPVFSEPARRLPAAEADASLLHEAVVLPEQQVLLHLGHRVERDADDDEQ